MIALESSKTPFLHAISTSAFPDGIVEELRDALVSFPRWERSEGDYAHNYSCFFKDSEVPDELSSALSPEITRRVRASLQATFGVEFANGTDIMLNKYVDGDGTRIHNDHMTNTDHPYFFTHRALLYLNTDWSPEMGGVLGLFDAVDATQPVSVIEPRNNTMVAMAMGPHSHHAVSALRASSRYSIAWSFSTPDKRHQA